MPPKPRSASSTSLSTVTVTPRRRAAALVSRSASHFGDFCRLGVLVRSRASTTASVTALACAKPASTWSRSTGVRTEARTRRRSLGVRSRGSAAKVNRYAASQAPSATSRAAAAGASAGNLRVTDEYRRDAWQASAAPADRQPAESPSPIPTSSTCPGSPPGRGSTFTVAAEPGSSRSSRKALISLANWGGRAGPEALDGPSSPSVRTAMAMTFAEASVSPMVMSSTGSHSCGLCVRRPARLREPGKRTLTELVHNKA